MDAAEPIEVIRDTPTRLREDLDEQSAPDTLRTLQLLIDEATALRLTAIRIVDAQRRGAGTARQRDTAAELADQLEIERGEARRVVAGARTLESLPTVADALEAGEISPAAATAITRARRQPADVGALERAQEELVELARTRHPDEVARRARWVVAADHGRADRRRQRQQANRGVRLRNRDDGLVGLEAALLPEVGEAWRTILDPLIKATYRGADRRVEAGDAAPGEDRRSAAQRMHDAFDDLAQRILAGGLTPEVHRAPPRVLVCIDLRELDPARHTPELLDALGIDPVRVRGAVTSMLPRAAGLLPETGQLLPAEVVRRLADEGAELVPLLFDGFTPLARGRTLRTADHHLRLGLVARDHGCVDCGAPPSWCDADHDPPWDPDGRTDPDAMVLRCRPEHVERHRRLGLDPPARPPAGDCRSP